MPKIDYTIKRSRRLLGNINLRVKDGKIYVSAPFWVSQRVIEDFVQSKSAWLAKVLGRHPQTVTKKYTNGETQLFFGQEVPLSVSFSKVISRTVVNFDGQSLKLSIYSGFNKLQYQREAEKAILSFYLQELSYYLTEKVNYYCQKLSVTYSKIEIKKVSSIWGSCSPSNVLSFNRKLIQSPKSIIDYVVIHEVCHLKERNHSSRFWALVSKFDRDYKNHRRWLHQNGVKLDI